MAKYLTISYDDNEQQTIYDHVVATTEDEAKAIIGGLRPYAIPVAAFCEPELKLMVKMLALKREETIEREVARLKKELAETYGGVN
jgi:hypothetical protein